MSLFSTPYWTFLLNFSPQGPILHAAACSNFAILLEGAAQKVPLVIFFKQVHRKCDEQKVAWQKKGTVGLFTL